MRGRLPSDSGLRKSATPQQRLGDETPLISGNGRRAPDRRRVSLRWLSGSVLTGLTSCLLMGGALYAALDGRQQMAQPANILQELIDKRDTGEAIKGDRPVAIVALQPVDERILLVPTVTRVGDDNVIRKRPFAYASAPLAIAPQQKLKYPGFDALAVFSASGKDSKIASSDVIYGADIESEVRIKQIAFPLKTAKYDLSTEISSLEAEMIVRDTRPSLEEGAIKVAALPYLDTSRFALNQEEIAPTTALDIRIVAANVSTVEISSEDEFTGRVFSEEVVTVPREQSLKAALSGLNLEDGSTARLAAAMTSELGQEDLAAGTKLRVAWEQEGGVDTEKTPRRLSVYRGGEHIRSVAMSDDDSVVWASPPAPIPAVADDETSDKPAVTTVARANLPNVYDGVYRAALSQGLNIDHAKRIIRTVAFDVDFRTRIKSTDDLEIFYSLAEGQDEASEESEILYIALTLDGVKRRYYRFRADDDGSVDYYDENGKSAKKFLLRKPVPNGKFRSAYGMRRHPISRTYKLHSGVDFSAPRGTPIIAAGNGIVEKAGWSGGYGRQTVIRHTNGYKTSYNHQHRFARGIKPGARVRQGQIIGQVGSTGYSTGPHLHYEVIVNGNKVNPMKIRLPKGRVLQGEALASFKRERDRIDALLEKGRDVEQTIAALN